MKAFVAECCDHGDAASIVIVLRFPNHPAQTNLDLLAELLFGEIARERHER